MTGQYTHVTACFIMFAVYRGCDTVPEMAEEETLSDPTVYLANLKERCPGVLYVCSNRTSKLLAQTGKDPYDPKDVNQQYVSDYCSWASMKQRVNQSKKNLRRDMLTPHAVNEPVAADEFVQQTEALSEVGM